MVSLPFPSDCAIAPSSFLHPSSSICFVVRLVSAWIHRRHNITLETNRFALHRGITHCRATELLVLKLIRKAPLPVFITRLPLPWPQPFDPFPPCNSLISGFARTKVDRNHLIPPTKYKALLPRKLYRAVGDPPSKPIRQEQSTSKLRPGSESVLIPLGRGFAEEPSRKQFSPIRLFQTGSRSRGIRPTNRHS